MAARTLPAGLRRPARADPRARRGAVRPPRLHRHLDERGRRGLRRLEGAALPLLPRQAAAAARDRRGPRRAARGRWSPRSSRRRLAPEARLRALILRFVEEYAGAQARAPRADRGRAFLAARRPRARARRRSAGRRRLRRRDRRAAARPARPRSTSR